MAGLDVESIARGHGRRVVELVLREEVAFGRVAVENGCYSIRRGAFPSDVTAALRALSLPAGIVQADSRPRRRRALGGRVHPAERKNLDWAVY
jgi:hypothetical protein